MTLSRAPEGFKALRQEEVPLLQATFFESDHIATGAKHIHFAREDENNTHGAAIPTRATLASPELVEADRKQGFDFRSESA